MDDRARITLVQDCEGCEFATFEELWCGDSSTADGIISTSTEKHKHRRPTVFAPRIMSISIELHFWVHHRMHYSDDVERIRYAGLYLEQRGYRTYGFETHRGSIIPYRGEAAFVHPDLEAAGLDRTTCCYMYSWLREDLLDAFSL